MKFNNQKLIHSIQEKQKDRSIREIATEIGIGHSSLSRILLGTSPNMYTYLKIIEWLELPSDTFIN